VLQGWSKGNTTDHLINITFVVIFGMGAVWGAQRLFSLWR